MLFRRNSSGSDTFIFDDQKYFSIQSIDEKISTLSQALTSFIVFYQKNPPNPKYKDKHNEANSLYNAFITDFHLILQNYICEIVTSIPFFRQVIGDLPNTPKLLELSQIIIGQIREKTIFSEKSISAFQCLCTVESFCDEFLNIGRFTELFVDFIKSNHYNELCSLLISFQTDQFISSIKKKDAAITIFPVLNFIVGIQETENIIPENAFLHIITFVYNVFQLSFNVTDLQLLDNDNFLHKQHLLLKSYPFFKITKIFQSLGEQDKNYPIHPIVLKIYCDLFSLYGNDLEKRTDLLNYIAEISSVYTEDYANEIKPRNWFSQIILTHLPLFNAFTTILKCVAHVTPQNVTETINLMFGLISFPIKDGILFDDIMEFFFKLITEDKISQKDFGDSNFIKKIILNSPPKDLALKLEQSKPFQLVFKSVFDIYRIGEHSPQLIDKLIKCVEENYKYQFTDYVTDIMQTNYNTNILKYFIENLDSKYVPEIFYQILSFEHIIDTIRMFRDGDCFSIVQRCLNKGNCWIIPFLTFINTIVMHENNHFFDDWVILQSKTSPIFKVQKEYIQDLVLPLIPTDPIPIPSLVPLCDEFTTHSNYNLYLLGAYALPIYTKLGFQIDKIPNIKLITNRFVRLTDFETILDKNVRIVSELLMQPVDDFPIFEFFSGHGAGWLEPDNSPIYTMLSFNIRFDEQSREIYGFLMFNNIIISIHNDQLIAPDGKSVKTIEIGKWYNIILLYNKSSNTISFYIDKTILFSVSSQEKGILLQTIGNREVPAIMMSVSNNVFGVTKPMNESEALNIKIPSTSNILLKPMKSVGLALYNAANSLYSNDQNIMRLFERLGNFNQSNKDDYIRIIAMIPDICKIDYEMFFKHFVNILKEMSNFCEVGWTKEFALSIFWVKNQILRSEIFINVFNDFEFWSTMPYQSLIEFLETVTSFISSHKDILSFGKLNQNNFFRQLIYLIFAVQNSMLYKNLIDFYVYFLQFSPTNKKMTAQIVRSSNVWSLSNSMDLIDNPLEPFCLNFSHQSERQSYFVLKLLEFDDKTIFSLNDLLSLSFTTNQECSLKALLCLIQNGFDQMFLEQNISLLNLCFQRFPYNLQIWNYIYSKLCDTEIDITKQYEKLVIKNHTFISSIISMMISIFKKSIQSNAQKVDKSSEQEINKSENANKNDENLQAFSFVKEKFLLVFKNSLNYFTSQYLYSFIDLISGGATIMPETVCEEVKIPKSIKLNKSEMILVKPHIADIYKRWLFNVQRILEERSFKGDLSDDYCEFISDFLVSLVKEQCGDWSSKSPRAIYIICQYSDFKIQEKFFVKYLDDIGKSSKKVLMALADSLAILANTKIDKVKNSLLPKEVLEFCQKNEKMSNIFIKFLILIFPYIDNDLYLIMYLIKPNINSLTISQTLLLLQNLMKRESSQSIDEFLDLVLKRAKKVVYFTGTFTDEQSRLETAIKLNEDLRKMENINNILEKCQISENLEIPEKIDINFIDVKRLIQNLYRIVSKNAIFVWYNLRTFYLNLNHYLKEQEKFICLKSYNSYQSMSQKNEILSYRMSPFCLPISCPCCIIPSPFPIYTPSSETQPNIVSPKTTMFGLMADFDINLEMYEYLPQKMFRVSGLFYTRESDLLNLFLSIYGDFNFSTNGRLIRLDTKVPCVIFTSAKSLTILTGAQLKEDNILSLLPVTPQSYTTLLESAFLNEYGEYGMFCGRIVLTINLQTLLTVRPFIYCCHLFSFEVFSATAGNFILVLDNSIQIPKLTQNYEVQNLEEITDKWVNGYISNFDYLLSVNYFALRSFVDLSSYPVFPRIVLSFKGQKDEQIPMRDLSKPVQINTDFDISAKKLMSRFSMQKFFHAENVSNPMIVSSLLVRIIPFCRYQWFINEGWDAGDRNFLSIPFHLTITAKTMYELIPDHFITPEVFENVNRFYLKNGTKFDTLLPNWSDSITNFVEKHRSFLEKNSTRLELNNWIDLIFGVKNSSKDDYNIFNPFSYSENADYSDKQKLDQQQNWTEMCGQVPKKVFNELHKKANFVGKQDYIGLSLVLNSPEYSRKIHICKQRCILEENNICLLTSEDFANACHISQSKNGLFVAVTFSISLVRCFMRSKDGNLLSLCCLRVTAPLKTEVCESCMIAVTICEDKIVFWSISSGSILKEVKLDNLNALTIDNDLNLVFVSSGSKIYQFTISGTFIRLFESNSLVSSICSFGCTFSFEERNLAVGSTDGIVRIYVYKDELNQLEQVRKERISKCPITRLISDPFNNNLFVFDTQSIFTSLDL
ncbi:Beige/BEACH domain containing protein [Trichomonas vaginalis G3]|uniref:Beige/BEACH domain containing protein n=1 Tax=Trichomonas vaginalis (strain ATCC PRA-98 / G3) TaxID=412133 RepID=A2E6D0_TRIV3|nr:aggrephagy protein [Trichomonas vaginalis G3]EAY11743.1 Beige/BEACH domain containing protein [Trichomonas vaginalis G3]KAI5540594.1 aggrephagy protein [Trichomonas vaginalis G3]|eukprot:XP_001323966.1 Beige/BEACH domain containing protein [Trichomonas vaginalis G3]